MRWITFVLTVSVLCLGPNVVAMYSSTAVTELTPSNFESKLKSGVWMVEFYAPWYVVVVGSALVELLVSVCVSTVLHCYMHSQSLVQVWSLSATEARVFEVGQRIVWSCSCWSGGC
jgi:hypothetical protein